MKSIAVVGLGKVGLPLAAAIVQSGASVIGIDIDSNRCDRINRGNNPIPEEPGLSEILKAVSGKHLRCTPRHSDFASEIDCYIVIVPLFTDKNHRPDFSILDAAFNDLAKVLKPNDTVVLETTVPPGTVETRFKPILDRAKVVYHLGYSPERIMTGHSISRYREFPKVVSGLTAESLERIKSIYGRFCSKVVPVSSIKTAELVKVTEGMFRDLNIALANEVYKACQEQGINFNELREAANHQFCQLHTPGIVGGHCIPVYPHFFLEVYNSKLVRTARETNDAMIDYTIDRLKSSLAKQNIPLAKSRVAIIGVTYREGVISNYLSPGIRVAERLKDQVGALLGWDGLLSSDEIKAAGLTPITPSTEIDFGLVFHRGTAVTEFIHSRGLTPERVFDLKN